MKAESGSFSLPSLKFQIAPGQYCTQAQPSLQFSDRPWPIPYPGPARHPRGRHPPLTPWPSLQAQFLDRHRILIQWVPPDLLAGPQRHGLPHVPPPLSSQHAAHVMLYNLVTSRVEALWGAGSLELAEW